MIIVKVVGGLGNQMFQYALGRSLQLTQSASVAFDITDFDTYKLHAYGLEHFNVDLVYAQAPDIAALKKYQQRRGRFSFLYNKLYANSARYVQERTPHFDQRILETEDNTYLDGYWQTEKYFSEIAPQLRKDFTPRYPLSTSAQEVLTRMDNNSISLHIRRGDYVTNAKAAALLGAREPEYYKNALTRAMERTPVPHVFVFSDDTAWVKAEIAIPCQITYVSDLGLQNWEELILMSHCRAHIISNSSFSWWGAWLDPHDDKLVIAPTPWFRDPRLENKDIAPPSWIRMS